MSLGAVRMSSLPLERRDEVGNRRSGLRRGGSFPDTGSPTTSGGASTNLLGSITARGVTKVFGSRPGTKRVSRSTEGSLHPALEAVDLHINPGEFVALVGASGCGKTTLLNMMAGLLPPTTGELLVSGRPPQCPIMEVGYMFARNALLPWRTVLHNVELGLEARGWSRRARRSRAREMLDLVGLPTYERFFPAQLSQGMRQRVSLARTLAPDPSILLMDEPFAALDARTKLALQSQFLSIWERSAECDSDRKTVVFVTHDLQEATLLADRVIVMLPSPGRIALDQQICLDRPRANVLGEMMFHENFRATHRMLFDHLEGSLG